MSISIDPYSSTDSSSGYALLNEEIKRSENTKNRSDDNQSIQIEDLEEKNNVSANTTVLISEKPKDLSSCNAIAKFVLEAFPLQEQKTIGDVVDSENEDQSSEDSFDPEKFYEFFTHEILAPQEYSKKKRAYNILASAEEVEKPSWSTQSIINEQVWTDLNLLIGNREHPTIFLGELLSGHRSHSEIGKAFFNGLLARPIEDATILDTRQQIVKELVDNEALFNEIDALLIDFSKHEPLLTGLWGKEQLMQFIKQEEYFTGMTKFKNWPRVGKALNAVTKGLNNSSIALEAKSTLNKVSSVYSLALSNLTPLVLLGYGLTQIGDFIPEPVQEYTDAWMTSRLFAPSLGIVFPLLYMINNRVTDGISAFGAGFTEITGIQRIWKQFKVQFMYDDFLLKRLASVAQCVRIMQKLGANTPHTISRHLTFFKHINFLFKDLSRTNKELAELIKNLNSGTFDTGSPDKTTIFFLRGKMLLCYRKIERVKRAFEPAIAAIGELDAYITIAKLIKESKGSEAQYCFPEFLKMETPYIRLEGFWNSFIDPKIVVANSINLGKSAGIPHMVVTGPNSGGKSTIVCRGIPLTVIMAQSLGIAPAKEMSLTPISHVAVYMNIADSIVSKESRFQREGTQAFAHGDYINSLSERGAFSLAVFDEIFSGTSPEEGAEWGYKTARGFASYQNCICVIATHFVKLTHLEQETNGLFINQKVSIAENQDGSYQRDENGKMKRTYTLERGISTQHIAREVLEEQGIKSPFFIKNFGK